MCPQTCRICRTRFALLPTVSTRVLSCAVLRHISLAVSHSACVLQVSGSSFNPSVEVTLYDAYNQAVAKGPDSTAKVEVEVVRGRPCARSLARLRSFSQQSHCHSLISPECI